MRLNEIKLPAGRKKRRIKRVGRGDGSGWGSTSGRGHKGQKARSGGVGKPGFEGGQMPLIRRLPKRGFTYMRSRPLAVVNVGQLDRFPANMELDTVAFIGSGLVKKAPWGIKLLGNGEISHVLKIKVAAVSDSARKKIESAGGSVEVVGA